eukprot:1138714-Pelagomonas_calceolata.AAC.1
MHTNTDHATTLLCVRDTESTARLQHSAIWDGHIFGHYHDAVLDADVKGQLPHRIPQAILVHKLQAGQGVWGCVRAVCAGSACVPGVFTSCHCPCHTAIGPSLARVTALLHGHWQFHTSLSASAITCHTAIALLQKLYRHWQYHTFLSALATTCQ